MRVDTSAFVDETFMAIRSKSYIPGYVPPQLNTVTMTPFSAPSGPASYGSLGARGGFEGGAQSRKRSYNDRQEDRGGYDPHYGRGDRQMKQMRRGNMSNGRGGGPYGRHGGDFQLPNNIPTIPPPSATPFPGIPMPPPGMPFDPNDPIGAILAMQAMGFPPLGIPDLSQAGSPTGFVPPAGGAPTGQSMGGKNKINARCRDYDTKGFCARGNACPFDHGNNRIVVPGVQEGSFFLS